MNGRLAWGIAIIGVIALVACSPSAASPVSRSGYDQERTAYDAEVRSQADAAYAGDRKDGLLDQLANCDQEKDSRGEWLPGTTGEYKARCDRARVEYLSLSGPGVSAGDSGSVSGSGTTCPADHPVKGNDNSMIYHVSGQRYYAVTNARHCFRSQADAEAAGYRASKV